MPPFFNSLFLFALFDSLFSLSESTHLAWAPRSLRRALRPRSLAGCCGPVSCLKYVFFGRKRNEERGKKKGESREKRPATSKAAATAAERAKSISRPPRGCTSLAGPFSDLSLARAAREIREDLVRRGRRKKIEGEIKSTGGAAASRSIRRREKGKKGDAAGVFSSSSLSSSALSHLASAVSLSRAALSLDSVSSFQLTSSPAAASSAGLLTAAAAAASVSMD